MAFDWIKVIQNLWHTVVADSKKAVMDDIAPLITFIEEKGGPVIIEVATGLLQGALPTAPWNALIDEFIPLAEAAGTKLAQDEAGIILNVAKAKIGIPA